MVRRGARLPALRLPHGRRRSRRTRPRVLEWARPDAIAGRLPRSIRSTAGTIRESAAFARKSAGGAKRLARRTLADGLGLPNDPSDFVTFRDARTGLAYLRSCRDIWDRGMWLALDAYQGHVFWEFREVHDGSAGQWRRLAERLGGRGVPSLDEALRELQLEPVHGPLRTLFDDGHVAAVIDGVATDVDLDQLEDRLAAVLAAIAEATSVSGDAMELAGRIRMRRRPPTGRPRRRSGERIAPRSWAGSCCPGSGRSRRAPMSA